jgi:hypothetical protein
LFLCVRVLVLDTLEKSLVRCSFYISRRQRAKICSIQWTQEQQLAGSRRDLGLPTHASPSSSSPRCSSTPCSSHTISSRRPCSTRVAVASSAGRCRRPARQRRWPLQSAPAMGTCSWMASSARTGDLRASVTAASAGPTARSVRPTAQPTLTGM